MITLGEAAKALRLDRSTIRRYVKRGLPTTPQADGSKLVDLDATREWIARNGLGSVGRRTAVDEALDGEADEADEDGDSSDGDAPDLSDSELASIAALFGELDGSVESVLKLAQTVPAGTVRKLSALGKARKDLADAEKQEIEVQRRRGELLEARDVERRWTARVLACRSGLLSLPAKLAARVAGREPHEVQAEAEREVGALLAEFQREWPD